MLPSSPLPRTLAALFTLVFLAVLVRTAWISDDALITLRTVLNVTHGYGLVFNITERVQSFTHPLWLVLLTGAYTAVGNVYYATFALAMGTSVLAFWIAVRRAASVAQAVLVAVALVCSRAFVDFSTSGLENPLSYVLLALFVTTAFRAAADARPRLTTLWLLASLLYLTRPDDVVIVLPVLVMATIQAGPWRQAVKPVALGLLPAIAWTLFAIVYYGVPFPNTAYAKLGTGIPGAEMARQGLIYVFDSYDRDPLTGVTIAFAIVLGLATRGLARLLAIGLVLHLAYVVWIGGDFMAGRFMAVPFFGAVLILGWLATRPPGIWIATTAALVLVAVTSGGMPLMSDSRFSDAQIRPNGIVDERALYFKTRSLLHATRAGLTSPVWPRYAGPPADMNVLETCGLLGAGGIDWGPTMHMLDECALADPLLARLPAVFNPRWRIGHFRRLVPEGYHNSLAALNNQLTDAGLRALYDDIRTVTQSRVLLSSRRFAAIWRLNTGASAAAVDPRFYRHAGAIAPLDRFATVIADGTSFDGPGVTVLHLPIAVTCDDRPGRRYIDLTVDADDRYEVTFLKRNTIVGVLDLGPVPAHRRRPGLYAYTADLPADATRLGFDTIVVAQVAGDKNAGLGHVLLDGNAPTDPELHRRVARRDGMAR